MAEAVDPVRLALSAGIALDPWQSDVVRDVLGGQADRVLLNCSRQAGKSTTLAVLALMSAMRGGTALIVSPALRQSQEVFRDVARLYRRLERRPVEPTAESALRIAFANGGRVIALPGGEGGDSIRGYTVDLLLIDEAARVTDELFVAVRPMVAVSKGAIVAASTPAGMFGWFYDEWVGHADWKRVRVPWDRCPRLGASVIDAERESLGVFFRQEYECEFATSGATTYISLEQLNACINEDLEVWD
jgi:phage terminase large subunit-like protein